MSQNLQSDASIVLSSGVSIVLTDMGISQSGAGEVSGTGRVILTGTNPVVLENSGSNDLLFYDLEIDNSGGVTLDDPIEVTNNLILLDGIIDAHTAPLNFGASATVVGTSNASHIDGEVIKEGSADFSFPVGNNGIYQPIEIEGLTGTAVFSAQYFDQSHPDPIGPWFDGNNWPISTCDYWSLEKLSGIGNAEIRLTYGNNLCNEINDFDFLRIARYVDGTWEVPILLGDDPAPGSVATLAPASVYGDFALASDNGFTNILPIELIEFNAEPQNSSVLSTWITASEINNDYFVVEKSANGEIFEEVGRVDGAGNSNIEIHYQLIDPDPFQGISYYRLKQVDHNGEFSHSPIVAVRFNRSPVLSLDQVYACDAGICVAFRSNEEILKLDIRDITGRLIRQTQINSEGSFIALPFDAARGIYILTLRGERSSESMRFFY